MSELEVTPDNCFLVDRNLSVRQVGSNFMDWLLERTPLSGRLFEPGRNYRVVLMHPSLRSWLVMEDKDPGSLTGYHNTYNDLHQMIPILLDHTLHEDVIQVLEHITIKEVE